MHGADMAIPLQEQNGPSAGPIGSGASAGAPADLPAELRPELRHAPRLTLLIRAAKILTLFGEYVCVVRDASETGVSVTLFHPLPATGALVLEMANGDRYPLERVWAEADKAGFRFATRAPLGRLVEAPSVHPKRAVRVNLELPCVLSGLFGRIDADLCNISQQGALVRSATRLALAQQLRLKAQGLPEVAARVRWRRGDLFGLVFQDTFQFAQFGQIVHAMQEPLRTNA